jgi:glutaconate CoA-transferase subunit B
MEMSRRRFVKELPFISTLGHGSGGHHRAELGLRTGGPLAVITDLCILEPEPVSKELIVTTIHCGVTREQVSAACEWPLRFADDVHQTRPPSAYELTMLRGLQERTRLAHRDEELS